MQYCIQTHYVTQRLKSLNLNGLCKYDSLHKAYIIEHSDIPVICFHILIFLKTLAFYTITQDTHQWYRINTQKIMDSHNIAICNDKTVNMVQLPPVEPNEANTIEIFARLTTTNSQMNVEQLTNGQPITNSHNSNKCSASSNNILSPDNHSTVILNQFSIIAEELRNFTKQVLSDITKNDPSS